MIPDFNGYFQNFMPLLKPFGVHVALGSRHGLRSFHEMCHADVLVTAASAMSHFAAVLCKDPVVLALPLYFPGNCLPNVVMAEVVKTQIPWGPKMHRSVTVGVRFNQTALEQLLHARFRRNQTLQCCPEASRRF